MSMHRISLSALSVIAAAACAGSGLMGPEDSSVDFAVIPTEVSSGDSLRALLVIRNSSPDTLRLVSGSSCVATLVVTFGGRQVPLEGTQFGCLTIIMQFAIAPGDSLLRVFPLRAALDDGGGAPQGEYRVRAVMEVDLPDVERVFVVRD